MSLEKKVKKIPQNICISERIMGDEEYCLEYIEITHQGVPYNKKSWIYLEVKPIFNRVFPFRLESEKIELRIDERDKVGGKTKAKLVTANISLKTFVVKVHSGKKTRGKLSIEYVDRDNREYKIKSTEFEINPKEFL